MKQYLYLALFLLVISSALAVEIEPKVIDALHHDLEASVIVILKNEPGKTETTGVLHDLVLAGENAPVQNTGSENILPGALPADYDFEVERKYTSIPGFSGTITADGFKKLEDDPRVEAIFINKVLHISLDSSVPQLNANDVWNFSVGGYNITGKGETICILDTGIDTDHPAFQDKIKSQYCYCSGCCPGGGSENNSAEDDNGHGTHVAGIVAGNLTAYTGMAKDAGIYAIKVCSSLGTCTTADIISGLDRCSDSANISTFNISVISISLGDSSQNNMYCNNDVLAPSINTAIGKNISVVIAAGNNGYTAGISSPACVQNATAVGAVNDNDAISYNRGAILELLAPGISITSIAMGGGTRVDSGTSMSAPHVSGAIALFRQYWKLAYSRTPTVDEIKRKLMISGKLIDDSANSGKTYSRIDILAALQPFINFTETSAVNNSAIGVNNSFINITSDVNLTNSLLQWAYNNGSVINITLTKVNGTNFYLNVTHLREGVDTYLVYGNDTVGTIGVSAARTVTPDFTVPAVTVSNPANGSIFGSGTQAFNATITDATINTVLFQFNNASGNDFNVTPLNVSGNWNININPVRFIEGLHSMTVYANDSARNLNNIQLVEFTVDRTPPAVTFASPSNELNFSIISGNQLFIAAVTDATLIVQAVRFSFDNASGTGFNLTAVNQSGYWVASYNVSTLAEGQHIVTIIANDTINNLNNTQNITFKVDFTPPAVNIIMPLISRNFTLKSSNQTFNVSLSDATLTVETVLFSFDNASGTGFNLTAVNQSGYWVASYNVSVLANGSHTITILANDTVGNLNHTQSVSFNLDTATPLVTLLTPVNGNQNSSAGMTFNCFAEDDFGLSNVTVYGNWSSGWHANETVAVSGTSSSASFSKTLLDGVYVWNCLAYDSSSISAFASPNFTITIDTTAPVISAVSSGAPASTSTTITWTTTENANATVNYGTGLSLGTVSSTTSRSTSQSRPISSLSASTIYFYNVTSCDTFGNCLTNGTFNFTTAAASDDSGGSSSSSGAGGGGGGGGGSGSATDSTEESEEETLLDEESSGGESPLAESLTLGNTTSSLITFSQSISFSKNKPSVVTINEGKIGIKEMEIDSKVDKETEFTISYLSEKPAEIPEIRNHYQYFEIKLNLTAAEIERAVATFEVPLSWLEENHFLKETVALNTFEKGKWKKLPTKLIEKKEAVFVYQAKLKHFSYFSITANSELEFSWFKNLIPPKFGSRGFVIFGMLILIAFLLILYWFIHKGEKKEDRV